MTEHTAEKWDRLGEFVTGLIQEKGVPGMSVGILHEGESTTAGFGVTSVENPLPVTPETLFQIGSITKTFTATAILRLVDQGKLVLDAPVRKYVPEFRVADEQASAQATVRHLLTHTGGWEGDFFEDTGAGDDALALYVERMAELPQLAPLGMAFSYNNSGFSLAGRLIEVVTGKTYEAALQELVLGPLGLEHSFLNPAEVMTHRFVVGHHQGAQGPVVAHPWPLTRCTYAAGALTCAVGDLLRYARFQMGDGSLADGVRLLDPASLSAMHTPQVTLWRNEYWGLGWSVDDTAGVRQVGHGGATNGQRALLTLVPERQFAIAVLTNADAGGQVTRETTRRALKAYLGVESPAPRPIETTREELAAFAGYYSNPSSELELGLLCGRLIGQMADKVGFPRRDDPPGPPPPPMVFGLSEPNRLLVLEGPAKGMQCDAIRRLDGSIGYLRVGLRLHQRSG